MNYRLHYDALIYRARGRVLDGPTESHHVIPRCMGGSDGKKNRVLLTPEEHFVAHQLLIKINPAVAGLIFAAALMANANSGHRSGNKLYGWLRRRASEAAKTDGARIAQRAELHARKIGVPRSAEARAAMSRSHTGKTMDADHCASISKGLQGKAKSPEHVAKVAASLRGKPGTRLGAKVTEETRQRMREAAMAREARKRQSAA